VGATESEQAIVRADFREEPLKRIVQAYGYRLNEIAASGVHYAMMSPKLKEIERET
jgi:hypothetical protein